MVVSERINRRRAFPLGRACVAICSGRTLHFHHGTSDPAFDSDFSGDGRGDIPATDNRIRSRARNLAGGRLCQMHDDRISLAVSGDVIRVATGDIPEGGVRERIAEVTTGHYLGGGRNRPEHSQKNKRIPASWQVFWQNQERKFSN